MPQSLPDAEITARKLYENYPQITKMTIGMNSTVDIVATLYFKDSEMLHSVMQEISTMTSINNVTFYEIVKVIGERDIGLEWLMDKRGAA